VVEEKFKELGLEIIHRHTQWAIHSSMDDHVPFLVPIRVLHEIALIIIITTIYLVQQ
jgi:hypothetical protein